jgi:predicted Zn-dependent protease
VYTRATNRKWWRPAAGGAAALSLALAVGACGSLPGARQIFLPDLPRTPEANSTSVREHQRVLSAYGGAYDDPKLQTKLTSIIGGLSAASEHPDLSYKITILNSPAVNAFALPSGQLYVTRGLLALANDSAEVASVISHEMAHVIAKHAAIRDEQAHKTEVITSDAMSGAQGGAMALARSKIALASFSRSQETEADTIGVGLAAHAGFDPFGASRLLKSMGRNADLRTGHDARSLDFMSSHPSTPERVKNVIDSARKLTFAGPRKRDREAYLNSIAGMKYGDDTEEGFVRGRQFIHPKLGFTFMAPEGFILDNTAQAVFGSKESAGQALRVDVVKLPADRSLIEYLNSGWIENIQEGSVEELQVNGIPAATAIAGGDPWRFRLYVVRLAGEVYRFIFAANSGFDEADKSFHASIQTFRRVSAHEKATRPLRLKIVKVQPSDTIESLAAGMAFTDQQVERFQVLNGIESREDLKVGELVKIVE